MTKISIYNKDTDVRGNDKWIGSDAQNQNRTKNFTPDNVATYFNENQVIDLGVELRYFYDTLDPLQERVYGSITFETEIGPQVNFSAISTFILSKYTMGHTDVSQFLDFLIGSNVILSRANNINMFGYYKIDSIEPYLPDPNFFVVTLTFEAGNGYMKEDEDYFISLVQFEQTIPDVPTKTSDLINDGQDGVHPFITAQDVVTPTLQSVTDEGNTTTNSILVESTTNESAIASDNIYTTNKDTGTGVGLGSDGSIGLNNGSFESYLKNTDVTNPNITLEVPNKSADGSYTIATTEDLPTKTSDLTNDGEDGISPFITAADVTPQVNSDWNATTGVAQILNKPTIPAGGLPAGGTAGQILTKVDATDYNATWQENFADWTSVVKHTVKNNGLSGTITKGTAVYVTGSNGTNMLVGRASNASEATSSKTMGLMQSDITTTGGNQTGFVITEGLLEGLNTATATAGDPVWLGVNGALIYGLANKPYAPAHLVFIGIVTKVSAGNGEIFVKVQNGFELKEIHDVDIITTTPINGHLLGFDGTLWVNKTIASWLGYTPVTDARTISTTAPLSGGGDLSANRTLSISQATTSTDGFLSSTNWNTFNNKFTLPALTSGSVLFSNGTTIAQDNANLFWDDTNNRLGIGTASPQEKLQVVGGNILFGNGYNLRSITSGGGVSNVFGSTASNELLFGSGNWSLIRFDVGGAAARMSITSNGNVLINTTTDGGYKLDVNGTARVSDISYLTLGARIGTTTTAAGIFPSGTSGRESLNLRSSLLPTDTGNDVVITNGQGDVGNTSSIRSLLTVARSFSPTSGTGIYNLIQVNPTINQTGGANGITRGLYINPTLTAAADFRAIEVANGVTVLAPSVAARASLRIPSGTAPTTPTNGDIWFDGTNLKMQIGGVTKTFTLT